jgi:hypothetical protein
VKEINATGGKITCTEFVDANGKRYDNWIQAIRLELSLENSSFKKKALPKTHLRENNFFSLK